MIKVAGHGRKFFLFIIESNFFIILIAVSLIAATKILFKINVSFSNADWLVVLLSAAAYKLSRINKINYSLFYKTIFEIAGLLLVSIYLITKSEINQLKLFIVPAIVFLLYYIPLFFNVSDFYKIRNNAILKVIAISFVWTWVTLIIPLSQTVLPENFYFNFIARFFFIAALAIGNDIADFKVDSFNGTKTLPVIFGKTTSIKIIIACLLLFIIFSNNDKNISEIITSPFIYSAALTAGLVKISFENKNSEISKLIVDSSIIFHLIIISGINFIF